MPVEVAAARARYGDFVEELVTTSRQRLWRVSRRGTWTYATPEVPPRDQGWKLHVSATLASANEVLRRAVPLLIDAGTPFKVASTALDLAALNSNHCPRPSSGKFITVYPLDDDQAAVMMASLDAATTGLAGPVILSDRPYRQGGLVHYRYGAFRGRAYISNDGDLVQAIVGPDGELVEDRRTAHFAPPAWAPPPPIPGALENLDQKRGEVLLDNRFVVHQALRYANKGGVFEATDKHTGDKVVVKQARAHVGGDERGLDARDLLANEAHVLQLLETTGVTPRLVSVFPQGGDSFLAEEALSGETLRAWNASLWEDEVPPVGACLSCAQKVAAVLAIVHQHGVIIRDFTPNNLIVQPDGTIKLIDLELAVPADRLDDYQPDHDPGRCSLTPAYGSPEQAAGLAPAPSDDSFAFGALLLFLFTGEDPYIDPDSPSGGTARPLAAWLSSGPRSRLVPTGIRQLALALTDPDPGQRPSVAGAGVILRCLAETYTTETPRPATNRPATNRPATKWPATKRPEARWPEARRQRWRPSRRQLEEATLTDLRPLAAADADRAIKDALIAIRLSGRPASDRFWPATAFGMNTDPRNVQHGVAGVIGALVQSWYRTADQGSLEVACQASQWLADRVDALPVAPVGVHFGAAGVAWSLFDAGTAVGDDRLRQHGADLALRLPTDWPGPDVTHGRAGLGLTLLHLNKLTGDDRFLAAAGRCADSLLSDVEPISTGVIGWRTPPGFRSTFAGRTFYGFAHGTAGIATFLLAMAAARGREDCLNVVSLAASSLVHSCTGRDGLVGWGEGPDLPPGLLPHWCNGASGIGSFLLRWWKICRDGSLVPVIEGAARTVMAAKWRSGVAYCHGLAGNGDFLLDAGDFLGDGRYHLWAADLASALFDRRVVQDGRCTFGDQPGVRTPDFNVGLAGVLSFFLRLRHGGPRLWMVDQ
jgi:serine/threonine protein kinase